MGLPIGEGYCDLAKKSAPKGDMLVRDMLIRPSNAKTLKNSLLQFCDNLLHYILIKNVLPRQEGRDNVTIFDQALMIQVLQGELIDSPRVVLRHMLIAK